jgi:hypothetical protein
MMNTWEALAKQISADSWGQCALIQRNSREKGQVITKKSYLLSTIKLVSSRQKNSQLNKGILILTFKKCIAVLRRSCAITQRMAIALTFTFESAGSRRVGEIMVSLFFGGCAVCCGCVLGDGFLCV